VLLKNGSNFNLLRPLGGGGFLANGFYRVWQTQRLKENFSGFGQRTSIPQGYQAANRAIVPTLKESWDMFVAFRGVGSFTSSAYSVETLEVFFSGEGTFTPNAQHAINSTVFMSGEGSFSAGMRQLEQMQVFFDAGARPSAFDIAQEIWQSQASAYNAPGTMGNKVNAAGAAADPWGVPLPGGYLPGTAGYIVGVNIDTAISDVKVNTDLIPAAL
jgi:hypothetical protein